MSEREGNTRIDASFGERNPQDKYTYIISSNGINLFHCTYDEIKKKIFDGEIKRDFNIYEVGSDNTAQEQEIGRVSAFKGFFDEFERKQEELRQEKLRQKEIAELRNQEEIAKQEKWNKNRKIIIPLIIAGAGVLLFILISTGFWLPLLIIIAVLVILFFFIF